VTLRTTEGTVEGCNAPLAHVELRDMQTGQIGFDCLTAVAIKQHRALLRLRLADGTWHQWVLDRDAGANVYQDITGADVYAVAELEVPHKLKMTLGNRITIRAKLHDDGLPDGPEQ
jgi:hypothetical protein